MTVATDTKVDYLMLKILEEKNVRAFKEMKKIKLIRKKLIRQKN